MSTNGIFRRPEFKRLLNPAYLRLLGYTVTIIVHYTTIVGMTKRFEDLLQDPDVAYFQKYQHRLLTVWNVYAQVLYAALGLSCDVMTLARERKDSGLLTALKSTRNLLFSAIVFPISLVVSTVFWTLYTYEPTIILPPGVVKTLLPVENFVIHTFILPVIFWEVMCRPRRPPASHLLNLAVLSVYALVFIVVSISTYYQSGQFPYPIMTKTYGSIYFIIFLGVAFVCDLLYYSIQWKVTDFLWGYKKEANKIT